MLSRAARIAAALVVLSACSEDSEPDSSASRVFDLAGADAEERLHTYHRAREVAVADCMADAGFSYTPEEFHRRSLFGSPAQLAILSVDRAADIGYGVEAAARFISALPASPNAELQASLDPAAAVAYETALYGDDPDVAGGCLGGAEQLLIDDFADYVPAAEMVLVEAQIEDYIMLFELRSEAVWRIWSDCMSDAGYSYATTFEARNDVSERFDRGELDLESGALHEFEFPRAMADAECQAPLLDQLRAISDTAQTNVFGQIVTASTEAT